MFEHIHFQTNMSSIDMNKHTLELDPQFQSFQEENNHPMPNDSLFQLQGDVRILLERPLPTKYQENLMFIQSFSHMKMTDTYYTHRKNYPSYLLLYTYDGEGELQYDGKKYRLREGDGFLIDCKKEHRYQTAGTGWEHGDLHFFGGQSHFWYQECFDGKSPMFHCPISGEYQARLEQLLSLYTSAHGKWALEVSCQLQQLLLLAAALQIGREETGGIPDSIRYLQNYLEHHFEQNITLDEMADFCGLSKYHLCRQFKRYTAFSPKEYLLELRISKAKMLLQGSTIPAYKIGALVGIPNETNFTRLFRERVGLTPGEYRK